MSKIKEYVSKRIEDNSIVELEEMSDTADEIRKTSEDHIVSLSREVAKLKRQVAELSEASEQANYKAGQALTASALRKGDISELTTNVEMLIDDMVMLDERTRDLAGDDVMAELGGEVARVVLRQLERDTLSRMRARGVRE